MKLRGANLYCSTMTQTDLFLQFNKLLYFITSLELSGHYMYHQLNIQQFSVQPTQCIYVFCVDLRTNSDYFPIQHYLTGLYSRDGVCLLRGTDWMFIYN